MCYFEVVSTTPEAVAASLATAAALGVDCILGGTDLDAARRVLGSLERYFPFPGRPVGHPTRLQGSAGDVERDARTAGERGCGGIDLLAYRATEADPLTLVRAARRGIGAGRLIVAGSVHCVEQIHAVAAAGADAFTIGTAVFDRAFVPAEDSPRDLQTLAIPAARRSAGSGAGHGSMNLRRSCRRAAPRPPWSGRERPHRSAVAGRLIDPDTGAPTGIDIAAIAIEDTLRGHEADLVAGLRLGRRFAVVSDAVTHYVMGARVEEALAKLGRVDSVVLPREPLADLATAVDWVRVQSAGADALIAVGSGTINDLTKYAAARDAKPFAVFATAPSMNGYASANAAITVAGHKKMLPATLARGVFVDLEVLCGAPRRRIRAGLGESLRRATAQVDWLLSHLLLDTPYRGAPFALLEGDEGALLDAPEAVLERDCDAMRMLARTLVLSGIGMTLCGGSYPASQGEHLISHYLDMRTDVGGPPNLHGEQVAVATLAMARLQEAMLDAPAPTLHPSTIDERALRDHFGAELGVECWRDFARKRLDAAGAAALTARAAQQWAAIRRATAGVRISSARLEAVMRRAGIPVTPSDLGLDADAWRAAVRHARFIRDRFTFLDLAGDAGLLESPRFA